MELKNDRVILRDFCPSDIEDRIHWETVETQWQLWDAPWEEEPFDAEKYRSTKLSWLEKEKEEGRFRWSFEICINDDHRKHIGWCNVYRIDEDYQYTKAEGHCTIGINIADTSSLRKGYGTAAWTLLMEYLFQKGIHEIYTQTWSGNERVLGLMTKLGFEECHRRRGIRSVRGKRYDALTFRLDVEKHRLFCHQAELSKKG